LLAEAIKRISKEKKLKDELYIPLEETFYSSCITHSYYSIFYSAKSYLLTKNINTKPPSEHKKVFEEIKKLAQKGKIDYELFLIYKNNMIKANELLGIFELEKSKRTKFTYKRLPQANEKPAKQSLENSKEFFKHFFKLSGSPKI
jgi:uncharacterized protein (UPF0332 family)